MVRGKEPNAELQHLKEPDNASFPDKCNINIFAKRILYVHKIFSMSETPVWTDTSMCSFQG